IVCELPRSGMELVLPGAIRKRRSQRVSPNGKEYDGPGQFPLGWQLTWLPHLQTQRLGRLERTGTQAMTAAMSSNGRSGYTAGGPAQQPSLVSLGEPCHAIDFRALAQDVHRCAASHLRGTDRLRATDYSAAAGVRHRH